MNQASVCPTEAWGVRAAVFVAANLCPVCMGDRYELVRVVTTDGKKGGRTSAVDYRRKRCRPCKGTGKRLVKP